MSFDEIAKMPVADIAAKDCHLWLWTTGVNLIQAFHVARCWKFRYSALGFAWVKLKRVDNPQFFFTEADFVMGLGMTTRHNVELCLLFRRGNPKRLARDVRELIVAPVRRHSEKPVEAYDRIQRYCPGPYLELFGRQSRPNWTVWGEEATKFDHE
jgi:N6-adenosine-specific RNA methylase IME4